MKIKRFDIWIADLNPTIGTEPGKVRPVLVLQSDLLNRFHPSSIICPVTTKVQPESNLLRVHLVHGTCGLDEDCDVMIDQVRSIDNKRLVRKVGTLPVELRATVSRNLKTVLDLE